MMNTTRILVVLGAIGLALLAAIARVRSSSTKTEIVAGAAEAETTTNVETITHQEVTAEKTRVDSKTPVFSWHRIESSDYRQYVANLRAIGCPEQTLRDIVIADVTKMFAPREQSLKAMLTNATTVRSAAMLAEKGKKDFEIRKQLRAVQLEKNALLQELVGVQLPVDLLRTATGRNYAEFEAAFNALPPGKRDLVRDIQETYWQNSTTLSEKFRGTNANSNWRTPEYLVEYSKLNQERRAALAKVMTPVEMEDYEMRITDTGMQMRSELANLKVSEEEFRRIFRARREVESPYGGGNLTANAVEDAAAGTAAMSGATLQDEIRKTLGDERYSEYLKSRDYAYQTFTRLGERFGLSSEVIEQAYAARNELNQRMTASSLKSDQTPDQMANLRQMKQQYQAQLNQLLGERAAKALVRNYGDFSQF